MDGNIVKKMRAKRKASLGMSDRMFEVVVTVIVTIFLVIVLYPLVYVVSASFSSGKAVNGGKVLLWPVELSLTGYQLVFENKDIWVGYANTLFYVLTMSILNMVYTTLIAYVLSRKTYQGRKLLNIIYLIPMWFRGGLVPEYVLISKLNMVNSRWGFVFLAGVMVGNMVIMRTYFRNSIPEELLEATQIDGGTDFSYLFKVALPLAKPVISVVSLYTVVAHWNDYFGPLIYLREPSLQPLQLIIQGILQNATIQSSAIADQALLEKLAGSTDVMKYALIVVSAGPMLLLFPFVQKFFEKGVMLGSLKG